MQSQSLHQVHSSPRNVHQQHATLPNQPAQVSPTESGRNSSLTQARKSNISHMSYRSGAADGVGHVVVLEHSDQEELQKQLQAAKNGRVGIFGNYLASRISTHQQQKFLLSNGTSSSPHQTQDSAKHEEVEIKPAANIINTSNTVTTNMSAIATTALDNTNSFRFGAPNFGSISSNIDFVSQQPVLKPKLQPQNPVSLSPFEIQGKPKQIVTRKEDINGGSDVPAAATDVQRIRKERRERNMSAVEQAIAMLPLFRHDQTAAQTFEQNTAMHSRSHNKKEQQYSGSARPSQDQQPASVNKSFQGNLTKILRQVNLSTELSQQQQQVRSSRKYDSNLTNRQSPGTRVRGTGFINNTAQLVDSSEFAPITHYASSAQQSQAIDTGSFTTRVGAVGDQRGDRSGCLMQQRQLRGHATTPAIDLKDGVDVMKQQSDLQRSPRQIIRSRMGRDSNGANVGGGGNSLAKSFEQRGIDAATRRQQQQQVREKRNVPINQIYMGPELPGVYTSKQEAAARKRPLKPYDHISMATSTSQVITDASGHRIVIAGHDAQNKQGAASIQNQPINSKLNAALRHRDNLRLLGENRQLQQVDKIWGRFDQAIHNNSQPQNKDNVSEQFTLGHNDASQKRLQAVPGTTTMIRETAAGAYVRVPAGEQNAKPGIQRKYDDVSHMNTLNAGLDSITTPVWLQKHDGKHANSAMVSRNAPIVAAITRNQSKGHAIEFIAESQSLHRAADQQFEYKDFNFISRPQQREGQNKSATLAAKDVAPYADSPRRERHNRTNSPSMGGSGRYQQMMHNSDMKLQSQNQYLMQYLGQKKRLSTDVITSRNSQTNDTIGKVGAVNNQPGSIKIQIDNNKIGGTERHMSYAPPSHPSHKNLFKLNSDPISHVQIAQQAVYKMKDKSQSSPIQWPLPSAIAGNSLANNALQGIPKNSTSRETRYAHQAKQSPQNIEEMKPRYHVTIEIDSNAAAMRSPTSQKRQQVSPDNATASVTSNPPIAQSYHQSKQQALQLKQHTIPGLPITALFGESSPNARYMDQQLNAQAAMRINKTASGAGMSDAKTSPRRSNQEVFSPEPKLIELPTGLTEQREFDAARMKNLPIAYPNTHKRNQHARIVKGQLGAVNMEDRAAVEYFMQQLGSRLGVDNNNNIFFQQNGVALEQTQSYRMVASSEVPVEECKGKACEENPQTVQQAENEQNSAMQRGGRPPHQRQHYLCPYASAKIARLREEKAKARSDAKAARELAELKRPKQPKAAGEEVAVDAVSAQGEEIKSDSRTAEQKAEDLKNHQRELLRKFVSKFPPKRLPNVHAELEEERQRFMQARKDANRKYTEISANNNKPGKNNPLKYVIFEGNNSNILKRVMQSRLASNLPQVEALIEAQSPKMHSSTADTTGDETEKRSGSQIGNYSAAKDVAATNLDQHGWQETNTPHLFNFKWKPFSNGINFERLGKFGYKQLVNHIEGHQALTTKDQMFLNLKTYCEKKNLDVYDMIPLTFDVDFSDLNFQIKFDQILQIISLFEKNITLSPTELSNRLQSIQNGFDKVVRSPLSVGPSDHQGKNLWLLKPTGFNRGIGIHVFNSLDDLKNILWTHYRIGTSIPAQFKSAQPPSSSNGDNQAAAREARDKEMQKLSSAIAQDEQKEGTAEPKPEGKELKNSSFIVQKYIEAPLLFRKRKFDIRIWAVISHDTKFYVFKEAYVRTSSEEYDLSGDKLDQVYVHLTNNAVQKYSKNYGAFEEGNIVSVKALAAELSSQEEFVSGLSGEEIERSLYEQMREQIRHTYEAVRSKMKFTKHTFELVGYDFMVVPFQTDDDSGRCSFKTRLIEANTNPCLEESNSLLKDMIPRMLDDMLKIVMDPLFGTTLVPHTMQANETENGLPVVLEWPVEGYANGENMFELLTSPP